MKKFMRNSKTAWTKKTWKSTMKEGYLIKGGPNKGKVDGSVKKVGDKYYRRENFSIRNDKVAERKKELRKQGYSVRTVKDGKFTSIFKRPNFERKTPSKKSRR